MVGLSVDGWKRYAKTKWGWIRLQNYDVLLTAEQVNEFIRKEQEVFHNRVS
jgi:hypothetical protein